MRQLGLYLVRHKHALDEGRNEAGLPSGLVPTDADTHWVKPRVSCIHRGKPLAQNEPVAIFQSQEFGDLRGTLFIKAPDPSLRIE